ncbi:hypothetical protein D3C85_1424740 [compost metagenome]
MNGPRDHFLAGTGLAQQQDGVGAMNDLADQGIRSPHGRALADQPIAAGIRDTDRHSSRPADWLPQALQQL